MSYDQHTGNQLDNRINQFMARKELEHPELKESVDELYHDLTKTQFSSHFHMITSGVSVKKRARHINRERLNDLHYAV